MSLNQRKIKKLTMLERGYVAGVLDGEGTITLSVKQRGGTHHLAVTVSGTERSLINYLQKTIGAGKVTNKKIYQSHHKPSFTYSIYSRQALDVLKQVEPHLQTYKKKRARLVLDEYIEVTPMNGKYSDTQIETRKDFEKRFFDIVP